MARAIEALGLLALQGHGQAFEQDVEQLGQAIAAIEATSVWFIRC